MSSIVPSTTVTVIPTMRYEDAPAAIEWLCDAFGFARHALRSAEDGGILTSQINSLA